MMTFVAVDWERLPRRFFDAGYHAVIGELPEAEPADVKIAHVATLPAALEATADNPRLEFRGFLGARNY